MMSSKIKQALLVISAILSIPFVMWLSWMLTSKKKLVAIIVDKTVEKQAAEQHTSFTWILNYDRFSKTKTSLYNNQHDYFGFFPQKNEKYQLKGLERFSPDMLKKLAEDADMVYYTDTYGVYKKDWYHGKKGNGIIYGGMSEQDIRLLQLMKSKRKLILAEFNTIATPTPENIREDFENLFGLKWTGWIGSYYFSLDPQNNADLPSWIMRSFETNSHMKWHFQNPGIVFINTSGKVVVLEEGKELSNAFPVIETNKINQEKYGLPYESNYPSWFDVMSYDSSLNETVAEYRLKLNTSGEKILSDNNIPVNFPAILKHKNNDYRFYYFSGNFCDNPVSMSSSYFKGIPFFKQLFLMEEGSRPGFFWNFYLPLMHHITNDYFNSVVEETRHKD